MSSGYAREIGLGPQSFGWNSSGVLEFAGSVGLPEPFRFKDSHWLTFGDADDVQIRWDGTDLDILAAANNSVIKVGNGTNSFDVWLYGSAAANYVVWDASANDLIFQDSVSAMFGTGSDVEVRWDGTDLDVLAAADNSVIKLGNGTNSFDLWAYGNVAADYLLWDADPGELQLVGDARLNLSNATLLAANTDGGLIKAGTSGARVVEDTANMKFISLYFDDGATSGEAVGIYNRLYVTGAGGSGESLRSFTSVENVAAATVRGAFISLNFQATGSLTGLGVATDSILHIPDAAMPSGGTYAAVQAAINSDGASSAPASVTELSFFRVSNQGNATGVGAVDDKAFLFAFTGGSAASGNMIDAAGNEPTWTSKTHKIRCKLPDGSTCYLVAVID